MLTHIPTTHLGEDSHWKKDKSDLGVHGRYDKYTPLNSSREKIYQECVNTELHKGGVRNPFPIIKSYRTDKTEYFRFHEGHDQNTDDCIELKDIIKGLIKRDRLLEYINIGKRERE